MTSESPACERSAAHPSGNPWEVHTVEIARIDPEIEGVATYSLAFRDAATADRYRFLPGQFNMLYLPGAGESAISLSADPSSSGTWAHTVRAVGNVTRALSRLPVGSTLGLRGPFGSCWPLDAVRGQQLILMAGGIGLAPLRPAIYFALRHLAEYRSVSLLYGARTPDFLLYQGELRQWQRQGMQVLTTVDRPGEGWNGNIGVVPQLLRQVEIPDPSTTAVLTCGPEVMMRYAALGAINCGVRKSQIWVSLERNMQCAVGLCGHCQLGPAFVCREGPVIRYDQIEPYLVVEGL